MNLTQKRRRKGEKSSCGKKKKVYLEKKGVLGEQSGDKKVYDNIYIYSMRGSFFLLQGHKIPLDKGFGVGFIHIHILSSRSKSAQTKKFMEALFFKSCCFQSDKGNFESASLCLCGFSIIFSSKQSLCHSGNFGVTYSGLQVETARPGSLKQGIQRILGLCKTVDALH